MLQIESEFKRFSRYMKTVRVGCYVGGLDLAPMKAELKDANKCPHIVVGTPGRLKQLVEEASMKMDHIKYFVVDECDKILDESSAVLIKAVPISCPTRTLPKVFQTGLPLKRNTVTLLLCNLLCELLTIF